jgi:cytoskeletal protein CcmA (bactofilin family)
MRLALADKVRGNQDRTVKYFPIFKNRKRRRAIDRVEFSTIIGEGTTYRGNLAGEANFVVHGCVVGQCEIEGHLVLKPGAQWNGDIVARHAVIAGEVTGDVHALEKLELAPTAHVRGDIRAPLIALAEGAKYDGQVLRRSRLVRYSEKREEAGAA